MKIFCYATGTSAANTYKERGGLVMRYRWELWPADEKVLSQEDLQWLMRREQEFEWAVSGTWWLSLFRESPVAIKTREVVAVFLLSLDVQNNPIGGGSGVFLDTSLTLDELFEELARSSEWEALVDLKNAAIESARNQAARLVLYSLGSDGSNEETVDLEQAEERQRILQAMRARMDAWSKGDEYSSLVF